TSNSGGRAARRGPTGRAARWFGPRVVRGIGGIVATGGGWKVAPGPSLAQLPRDDALLERPRSPAAAAQGPMNPGLPHAAAVGCSAWGGDPPTPTRLLCHPLQDTHRRRRGHDSVEAEARFLKKVPVLLGRPLLTAQGRQHEEVAQPARVRFVAGWKDQFD